jgi:hypothetical protein
MSELPEIEIWRAANLLIQQHGEFAKIAAEKRADELGERGDAEGSASGSGSGERLSSCRRAERADALNLRPTFDHQTCTRYAPVKREVEMKNLPVAFPLVMALPGCASIMKGSTQSINVATPPTTGAICTLTSSQGSWSLTSPGSVAIEKSKEDIQIRCAKPGWQDASGTIPSNFQGWTLGNILLGGVIGLGVDAATGAINEYPNSFQVQMTPEAPRPAPPPAVQPSTPLPPPRGRAPGM